MKQEKKKSGKRKGTTPTKHRRVRDPKERLSPWWLIGTLIVGVFVTGIVLLSTFLGNRARPFSYEDGVLTDRSDGTVYLKSSGNYEAMNAVKKVYGRAGELSLHAVAYTDKLGRIVTLDTSLYLTDGKGSLFLSQAASALPALSSFGCDVLYLCTDEADEITLALASFTENTVYQPAQIIDEYLSAPAYNPEQGGLPVETYKLYLTSSVKYPAFYYVMSLVRCDNGDFYIYTQEDRTGRTISSRFFEDIFASGSDSSENDQ